MNKKYLLWDDICFSWVASIIVSVPSKIGDIAHADSISCAGELLEKEADYYIQKYDWLIKVLSPFQN